MKKSVTGAAAVLLLLTPAVPAHAAAAKKPARAFDFNGDGRQDIVAGSPRQGLTLVAYPGGRKQKIATPFTGSYASADFDRDGYADLALNTTGGVTVIYGSKKGLAKRRALLATGPGDIAAQSLVVGDLDKDGRADLVAGVGAGFWTFSGVGRGKVTGVDHRFTDAPAAQPNHAYSPPTSLVPTLGDYDGDGHLDAVLAPVGGGVQNNMDGNFSRLDFAFAAGSAKGLGAARYIGISGGINVRSADFNGDGYTDLVHGGDVYRYEAPFSSAIYVNYGGPKGFGRGTGIYQNTPGVPGKHFEDSQENFGKGLAVADVNRDGLADIAVGDPADVEACCPFVERNSVTILFGSRKGVTSKGARRITAASPGIPGRTGVSDEFGTALRFTDLNGDKRPELLIGVPGAHAVYGLRNVKGKIQTTRPGVLRPSAFGLPAGTAFGYVL